MPSLNSEILNAESRNLCREKVQCHLPFLWLPSTRITSLQFRLQLCLCMWKTIALKYVHCLLYAHNLFVQHLGKEVWLIENLWTDFGSNCLSFGTGWVERVLGHSVQPETRCFSMALWRSAPHCKHGFLDPWSLALYFVFVFIAKWPTAVIILSRSKWVIMYIHLRDWLNWLNLHMRWRASVMYPCMQLQGMMSVKRWLRGPGVSQIGKPAVHRAKVDLKGKPYE